MHMQCVNVILHDLLITECKATYKTDHDLIENYTSHSTATDTNSLYNFSMHPM